jgi:hypothetical protein
MATISVEEMSKRSEDLTTANTEEQIEERAPGVELPEVEVPSDLEDEFTPEVDDHGQIWWFVDSLVEKKMRYCKESKRRRWFYRTRFVGHGSDKDCWLTSDQLDCTDLVRAMHGLEPLAPARGSSLSVASKSMTVPTFSNRKWSRFSSRSGGDYMRVLDRVLEEFVESKRYTWGGEFST